MTGWAGGYVADVEYVEGFYPAQSPARLALACLMGGVEAGLPGPDEAVHYLELGCGRGLNALVIAAANPGWRVTAVDYNPAHVAIGRATARAARLPNVRFVEADLAGLAGSEAGRAIPPADFTTLHGVWTWVGPEVQAGIVRLLDEKVLPGAPVHVSYNALPAWQGAIGLQRLVRETGRRAAVRSDRQAVAGLSLARDAVAAGATFLADSPLARQLVEHTAALSPHYLSHEYMNAHWQPVFHADLAHALSAAKLDWVASASPLENFPELMLTEEQRALSECHEDPILRELVRDMCVPRQFRQDVFVRGARRIGPRARDAALCALELVPTVAAELLDTTLSVPAGKAEMGEALGRLMARALRGPARVGELLAGEPGRSNPSELVGVLVGSGQAQIATGPEGCDESSARRLNRVLGARVTSLASPSNGALASSRLGGGLAASLVERFIAARLIGGEREAAAPDWAEALSVDASAEDRPRIETLVHAAAGQRVPVLRALGIVPA